MSSKSASDVLIARLRAAPARLALAASFHADALAAALDLRRTDIDCLLVLRLDGPATPGQLAEVTGLSSGGVSGVVDRLERAGFVRRESDPGDRRRVVVSLAGERAPQLERLLDPLEHAIASALEAASESDLRALSDFHGRHLSALDAATARLRAIRADDGSLEAEDGVYTVPAGPTAGVLEFVGASGAFEVRGDASPAHLLRARIDGPITLRERDGTVTLGSRPGAFPGESGGEISLNSAVPWRVRIRGGALSLGAHLETLALTELAIGGGASEVDLALGRPSAGVRIRITGGDSHLAITRPAGVATRLRVGGGFADLDLDGERRRGHTGLDWTTPGFDVDAPHVDIAVRGGMTRITLGVA